MLFNSLQFFVFFPIVVFFYFLLPHKYRWILLLAASYYFYMAWKPIYGLLIFISTIIVYIAAIYMGKTENKRKRKIYLIISIILNLLILFIFKYFNFFIGSLDILFRDFGLAYPFPSLHLLLPIGISFYTFQLIGYCVDVYNGNVLPEKHFGIFALYVVFFPKLFMGPIERAANLLPQFYEDHKFSIDRVAKGMRLILWGLFKKIVIADNISVMVNHIYDYPMQFTGLPLIIATVFFVIQLYCDFSGYCDIAIGSAKVLGFDLMDNFNRPFIANSVSDFWKRWHISLTTWFRDYLYIPLGGNRVPVLRWYVNLLIIFLVSGLWHGANWTFIVWGAMHGFFLIFSLITRGIRLKFINYIGLDKIPRIHKIMQVVFTFTLVCISFIFFRANNLSDAWYILTHLLTGLYENLTKLFVSGGLLELTGSLGVNNFVFINIIIAIAFMEFIHFTEKHEKIGDVLIKASPWVRWSVYNFIILWIVFFGYFGEQPFIYFQF